MQPEVELWKCRIFTGFIIFWSVRTACSHIFLGGGERGGMLPLKGSFVGERVVVGRYLARIDSLPKRGNVYSGSGNVVP